MLREAQRGSQETELLEDLIRATFNQRLDRLPDALTVCIKFLESNPIPHHSEIRSIHFVVHIMICLKGPGMLANSLYQVDPIAIIKGEADIKDDTLQRVTSILHRSWSKTCLWAEWLTETLWHHFSPGDGLNFKICMQIITLVLGLPTRLPVLWTRQAVFSIYKLWDNFSFDAGFRTQFAGAFDDNFSPTRIMSLLFEAYIGRLPGVVGPFSNILEQHGSDHIVRACLSNAIRQLDASTGSANPESHFEHLIWEVEILYHTLLGLSEYSNQRIASAQVIKMLCSVIHSSTSLKFDGSQDRFYSLATLLIQRTLQVLHLYCAQPRGSKYTALALESNLLDDLLAIWSKYPIRMSERTRTSCMEMIDCISGMINAVLQRAGNRRVFFAIDRFLDHDAHREALKRYSQEMRSCWLRMRVSHYKLSGGLGITQHNYQTITMCSNAWVSLPLIAYSILLKYLY